MLETKIEQLMSEGKLQKEDSALERAEGLVREAVVDLDEAQKTQEMGAYRATFFLAYMAMLRSGRAFLILNGYRPANCSRHKTIVEVTTILMGQDHRDISDHFYMALEKQLDLIHNGGAMLNEIEAHDAFHYALLLTREIVKKIKEQDSDFHVSM